MTYLNFSEIIERIKIYKGLHDDLEVAKLLGFGKSAFSQRKTRNAAPVDKIKLFAADENINIDWLLTGEGEPVVKTEVREGGVAYERIEPISERVDPFAQAVADLREIFNSGDPVLIPAIQSNLYSFVRAVRREREISDLRHEVSDLRQHMAAMEEKLSQITIQKAAAGGEGT